MEAIGTGAPGDGLKGCYVAPDAGAGSPARVLGNALNFYHLFSFGLLLKIYH